MWAGLQQLLLHQAIEERQGPRSVCRKVSTWQEARMWVYSTSVTFQLCASQQLKCRIPNSSTALWQEGGVVSPHSHFEDGNIEAQRI